MEFDIRGNLTKTIEITLSEFQETFVGKWNKDNTTRYGIYDVFETYITDFKTLITPNFTMWIDGSFVETKKDKPNDIDFVIFIDFKINEVHETLIEKRFGKYGVKNFYGQLLDAYISPVYPDTHVNAFYTQDYHIYWLNQFSKTKPDRHQKKYPKGFIKISFNEK